MASGGETGHEHPGPSATGRGRGGFRASELNTIPPNVTQTRVQNMQNLRECDILANYVPINAQPSWRLQMYRVDFEPSVESVKLMRFLFKSAAKEKFEQIPIYDGAHECRSGKALQDKVTRVEVPDKTSEEAKSYTVTLTHTGSVSMGAEMVRTYNLHMKEFFRKLEFFSPQPGLHVHPRHAFNVGQDIMILRGFRTAANVHDEGRLLMNFEGAHKLIQRSNVCELMRRIRQSSSGDFREAIQSALTGKLVVTSYNKRAYRVEEVDFKSNPQSTFAKRDGSEISFVEYFKNAYNYEVRDKQQPLLTVVPSNKRRRGEEEKEREIKLVPEMCNIAGLTEEQRDNSRLKMDLIKASQIPPQNRVEHLRKFLNEFHANEKIQEQLANWGYSYAKDALKIKGHIIGPTAIGTGPEAQQGFDKWARANPQTADFVVRQLAVCPTIAKMAVVCGRGELGNKNKILQTLRGGFSSINLNVQKVETHDLAEGDQAAHYVRQIKALEAPITVAIVIVRSQNKAIYDAVKKVASAEMGLVTQVVTAKLMLDERKARSASAKIAIQVAAKVGGEPWFVDIPLKGTMVCGYDTHHDTANRGRSFGAFLASLNDRFSRWFSRADQHDKLDEMSTQVAFNMVEALKSYQRFNNKPPERVILYRDGVSEGQLEHVFRIELKAIQEGIAKTGAKIRFSLIVVNKRVGARFFMRAADNNFINPPPGTVIDKGATRKDRFDFYLISQSTRQGTISPTYYNIIHDEIGFGPEIHQKMAYKFCLLYYNWSGSVRVPAPCQYAQKLARLCGEHLHAQPNANLSERLHFL